MMFMPGFLFKITNKSFWVPPFFKKAAFFEAF